MVRIPFKGNSQERDDILSQINWSNPRNRGFSTKYYKLTDFQIRINMIEIPKFLNRLRKEYSNITTSQTMFKVTLINDDMQHWLVTFTGPEDTAYAGLVFRLEVTIPVGHLTVNSF